MVNDTNMRKSLANSGGMAVGLSFDPLYNTLERCIHWTAKMRLGDFDKRGDFGSIYQTFKNAYFNLYMTLIEVSPRGTDERTPETVARIVIELSFALRTVCKGLLQEHDE